MINSIIKKTADTAKYVIPKLIPYGACAGVIATGYFSFKAGKDPIECDTTDPKEKIDIYLKKLRKPILSGLVTCGLIFIGDRLHVNKETELMTLCAVLSTNYNKFKETANILTSDPDFSNKVIALSSAKENNPLIDAFGDKVLVYDEWHPDGYYYVSLSDFYKGIVEINKKASDYKVVTLYDWWKAIGVNPAKYGKSLGWWIPDLVEWADSRYINIDIFKDTFMCDGNEYNCWVVNYMTPPTSHGINKDYINEPYLN